MGVYYDRNGNCTTCGLPGSGFVADGVCHCLDEDDTPEVVIIGTIREDDDSGESFTNHTLLRVPAEWSDAQIAEHVKASFPVWHCQHSYDCCGRFYPRNPYWSRASHQGTGTIVILVNQAFYCNI